MEEDRTALRRLPGPDEGGDRVKAEPKSRLDRDMVEDADTRHEQFTDEADRWQSEE